MQTQYYWSGCAGLCPLMGIRHKIISLWYAKQTVSCFGDNLVASLWDRFFITRRKKQELNCGPVPDGNPILTTSQGGIFSNLLSPDFPLFSGTDKFQWPTKVGWGSSDLERTGDGFLESWWCWVPKLCCFYADVQFVKIYWTVHLRLLYFL